MGILNLPNTLTVFRIILIPVFVTAVIYERYTSALYLFLVASLTDVMDGLIARLKGQKTLLGTFLDPLADKFLLVTSFILFSYYGFVPGWLTIMVISRDIIVTIGWILLYMTTHTQKVEPSTLGKLSIAMQFILLCYVLIDINYPLSLEIKDALIWTTASFTVLSGLHYIYRELKKTGERASSH
ncbi:MAG: CDP-diacylglycerol--glycerol-3-phosphate 3-phosphatidyltransferase [Nitrospirae bacterium]|nr:CDP-diacylglycerol--glycerol-3-phosphate 3-phosphatidyltransferase [Nitrospirota bacterium]